MKLRAVVAALLVAACSRTPGGEATPSTSSSSTPSLLQDVLEGCTGTKGNGQVSQFSRTAIGFNEVRLMGSGTVDMKDGASFEVKVETDANVQESVVTELKDKSLVLSVKEGVCPTKVHYIVTLPNLRGATLSGSGKIDATKTSPASDVFLSVTGSGRIVFRGAANALAATVTGAGAIQLEAGTAKSTNANVSGSGAVKKGAFTPGNVARKVTGSGAIEL